MSTTTSSSALLKFEEIKGKVLAYIDASSPKNEESMSTDTEANEQIKTGNETTEVQKDQLSVLLAKVSSFVTKQDDKAKDIQSSEMEQNTPSEKSAGEEDLQTKLTAFVRSLSISDKGKVSTVDASIPTESRDDSASEKIEDKDPVKDIMDKLRMTFEGFGKKEESKEKSLDTIAESEENDTDDAEKNDANPIDEFFAFLQGIMKKYSEEQLKESNGEEKNRGVQTEEEKIPETGALCGAF